MSAGEQPKRFRTVAGRELARAQVSSRRRRRVPHALGKFGHGDMPVAVLRVELCDAHETRERLFHFAAEFECQSRGHELFDGFFGAVLFLQQERIPRHALGRLFGVVSKSARTAPVLLAPRVGR